MTDLMLEAAVGVDGLVDGLAVALLAGVDAVDEQLIAQLAGRVRAGGVRLAGEGGVLAELTKRLVESRCWRARSSTTWAMTAMTPPSGRGELPRASTAPRRC
jgi:hypothetical protein